MSNRTDIHRPTVLVTEDYEFVMAIDTEATFGDHSDPIAASYHAEQRALASRLVRTSSADRGLNQCHHCGAHMRYVAVLLHKPSGEHIAVGETCLDNRFGRATVEFQAMRKQAGLDRAQMRIRKLVAAFVEANPDLAWMAAKAGDAYLAACPPASVGNGFVADVARKLRQYGELSQRQVDAVRRSVVQDVERAAERAARQAAEALLPTSPVLTGRIVITGEVLNTKWQDNDFGGSLKMLVRDDRGFKVWGSVPSSIDVSKGDKVTFTATVEASADDDQFGFFKRPTKASVVEVAE